MPIEISRSLAEAILRAEAGKSEKDPHDPAWIERVEHLSLLCMQKGGSKTHIAFLGTAMLAKATDHRVDLFAIKPRHAPSNPGSFSARILCHGVLVPLSAELGFSLGVSGREPLNNQPYFRMTRLDDGTPVHANGKVAFGYMLELIRMLQALPDENEARAALRAFIKVRRFHQPSYAIFDGPTPISPAHLVAAVSAFVLDDSENGRRAQAIVAGMMDVFAGPERVESGRINDPSRRYPGDVCVRSIDNPLVLEKAIEVRDKPVSESDVRIFGRKCTDMGVHEAALVMVAINQPALDGEMLAVWANKIGIGITLFYTWDSFVDQALFWAGKSKPIAAARAVGFIHQRLVAVEASTTAVNLWLSLAQGAGDE